jgi:hypothetical protein
MHTVSRRGSISQENKVLVRRLVDAVMNRGELDVIDELYAPQLRSSTMAAIIPTPTSARSR